ncbi:MAG: hypothetical protein SV108_01820 [Pseudomonadota bacterium]|nr:hypothetical protein [Pseudomonadota bacterium]HJO35199.1 hypothetical protein [Gammaproteobacteria bacterium]
MPLMPFVSRELRWFWPGAPSAAHEAAFAALPGPVSAEPVREDCYLLIAGREDLNLKLRQGLLQLKWRSQQGGEQAVWHKIDWQFTAEALQAGPGITLRKCRRQRFWHCQDGHIEPLASLPQRGPAAVAVELTRLADGLGEAATLGLEVPESPAAPTQLKCALDRLLAAGLPPPAARRLDYAGWLLARHGATSPPTTQEQRT